MRSSCTRLSPSHACPGTCADRPERFPPFASRSGPDPFADPLHPSTRSIPRPDPFADPIHASLSPCPPSVHLMPRPGSLRAGTVRAAMPRAPCPKRRGRAAISGRRWCEASRPWGPARPPACPITIRRACAETRGEDRSPARGRGRRDAPFPSPLPRHPFPHPPPRPHRPPRRRASCHATGCGAVREPRSRFPNVFGRSGTGRQEAIP